MTKVINLIGGPGIGKSTLAAQLYADMKRLGHKVELVREVAKEWAWEEREIGPFDQIAMIGEQIRRESSLFNKVDYIITDSPVMLGAFYLEHNYDTGFMNKMVSDYYHFSEDNGIEFINLVLKRDKEYEAAGRYETEEAAISIDSHLINYLNTHCYFYESVECCHQKILLTLAEKYETSTNI